jgi:hypothetical protein
MKLDLKNTENANLTEAIQMFQRRVLVIIFFSGTVGDFLIKLKSKCWRSILYQQDNIDFFFLVPWSRARLSPLGTSVTIWPIIVPAPYDRWLWCVEQSVEWELAGETEVLEENLPQYHSVYQKSHNTWPVLEPVLPVWEAGD